MDSQLLPRIIHLQIEQNPTNVLSVIAMVNAQNAYELCIEYETDSTNTYRTSRTRIKSEKTRIDVLGLKPNTTYKMRAIAFSSTGTQVTSESQFITTSFLPEDMPSFSVNFSSSPSPGYVMMGITYSIPSTKSYALIVDNTGRIVWYRKFEGPVADFQKHPNGTYTVYSSLHEAQPHFYQIDLSGQVIREVNATSPNGTGPHELRILGEDNYLFGIEFRLMDLAPLGGSASANVRGIIVERHRSNSVTFQWRSFDHLQVSEGMPDISLTDPIVNPWHGNAIEIDSDGHLLVSFRNSDMIAKINSTTGQVLWRLGGKNNQFTFKNDPLNGFSHQHGIRRLQNGNIILFDNGNLHNPPVSRAVEYALDENVRTATMVWEYRGEPQLYSFALGFSQRLQNGNTLICFGTAQHVVEVDMSGAKKWELMLNDAGHFPYRAFRIDSLY